MIFIYSNGGIMMKRKLSILLILGLVLFIIPLTVHADAVSSGTCGENLTWTLDSTGLLTISGSGKMDQYSTSNQMQPWNSVRDSINEVIIKEGVTSIGTYSFYFCSNLQKITIPSTITTIEVPAFICNDLQEIVVSSGNRYYCSDNGILYNKDKTILIRCPEQLTTISIPDTVITIKDHAFYNCKQLTSIHLPESVTSIEYSAFSYCENLSSINLSDNITNLEDDCFYRCLKLQDIHIPAKITTIPYGAFSLCSSLSSVTIPSNIISIESLAFSYCSSLTNVMIPSNVKAIELYAFSNCSNLTSITIPYSVSTIRDTTFNNHNDNLVINCHPGSFAESFAKENNIQYSTQGHDESVDTAIAPTCSNTGLTEGTHCSVCGVITAQEIVPVRHEIAVKDAVEPTCTESGLTEGTYCTLCGTVITEQAIVPALGHIEAEIPAVDATCATVGLTNGTYCERCNAVLTAQEEIPKLPHDEVTDPAVSATCAEDGLTEGKHCAVCNEVIVAQEIVPAKGHTEVIDEAVAATCTETGLTEGKHCAVCNEVIIAQEIVPALGHDWNEPVYDWNEDNTQVTATRVCKNNEEHTETETVNTSFEIKKKASAEAAGAIEYTSAAFVNEAFSVQSKTIELGRDVTLQLFDHVTVTVPSSFYLSESSATPTYLDKFSSIAMSYRTINVSTYQELRKKLKTAFSSISEFTLNGISMIGVAENHRTYKDSGVGFIVDNQAVMIMFVITDDTAGSISADIMNSITVTEIPGWQTIIPENNSTMRIPGTFVFEGERNELYEYSDSSSGMELSYIVIDDPDTSYDTIKNVIGELAGYTVEKTNKNGYRIIASANSSSSMKYFYAGYMSSTNKAVIIMIGYTVNDQMDICNAIVDSISSATGFMLDANGQWYYLLEGTRIINNWIEDNAVWYYFGTSGFMQTGWLNLAGTWYYFEDTGAMVAGWKSIDGTWYYFNSSGAMATGWVADGENWYYFQPSGAMTTGWLQGGSTWYYFAPSGAMVTGTQIIDGTEYTFDASGAWVENIVPAQTGWVQDGGVWYYYSDDGAMTTGWMKDGETWYYFAESGKMTTGWMKDGNTWYYFAESGKMTTGWMQDGTTWYYFDNNGAMVTGTQVINGTEYTFDASGAWVENTAPAQTGWVQDGGAWYYYDDNGAIVTGWKKVSGIWYHFAKSGKMTTGWFEDKEAEAQLPAGQKQALWYWFDNGGKMATGWKEINGQWEMFADSGLWLYTWDGN